MLRRLAAWLVLALLFAQWATASYACPQVVETAAGAVAMPDMPDCHGKAPGAALDPDQPLLCKAHCDREAQTVNDSPTPQPSPRLVLWAVLDWNLPALQPARAGKPVEDRSAHPSTAASPPLYLRLLVLRN
jgi:hypothetical protein